MVPEATRGAGHAGGSPGNRGDPSRGVKKTVRLDRDLARTLARLAKQKGVSEAEILREGIEHVDTIERRKAHIEELIRWGSTEPEPAKIRFRMK